MPSENMIYADTRGNIGWVAGGIMPRRSWSGLLPVPGDGTHEWNGFVPGDQLPRAFNPPNGFIATANNNILPPGYTIPISYEWAQRYRIDRVRDALTGDRRFSVEDFKRLQHDDYSLLAQALVPQLIQAADRMSHKSADLPLMTAWDFRMSREQIAPTLFATWAPLAYRRIMEHEVQAPQVAALIAGRPNYQWLEAQLSGSRSRATDSLLVAAFTESVRDLERQFGVDRQKWEYGRIHVAELKHPLAARYDPVPVSRSGDGNTINATGGARLRQTAGASYREVIDLADFDNSFVTNTPGQSGDPRSSHYKDLLTLWGRDEYFPLVYSRRRVEEETERVQILLPRSSR
jgi:penicillin amidase